MKKILFLNLFVLFAFCSNAQEQVPNVQPMVYCEIVGTEKFLSTKCTVMIDYGQEQKVFSDHSLVDENGKRITFNSMVEALNFMSKLGWKFEHAYVVTHSQQNVYHWLLSKTLIGAPINEGIITHKEHKDITRDAKKEDIKGDK